jgi:hypothetical protein
MGKEEQKNVLKALDYYIENIVDGRIAYYIKQNKHNHSEKNISLSSSQPINITLPLGWHPEKMEKLKTLYRFLFSFGIIICEYIEFETHFIGISKGKLLWLGTRTELMFLIIQLINPPLKLIPPPAKNNLNVIIAEHFRDTEGDIDSVVLKVSKSKGIGNKDRFDILNKIVDALK